MENNNLINFLNNVSADKNLTSEFFAKKNFEDMYKFALEHSNGGFSKNELQKALDILEIYADKMSRGKLSESELEQIAGGGKTTVEFQGIPTTATHIDYKGGSEESTLRSIAMLAGPVVNLLLGGSNLITGWVEAKRKYDLESTKLRIKELEQQLALANQNRA